MSNTTHSEPSKGDAAPAGAPTHGGANGQAPPEAVRMADAGEHAIPITKPGEFDINRFKSKKGKQGAGVETLQVALPHHKISDAKDFVRLHPNEDTHWTDELCFVNVPIKGQKRDLLHLIDEDLVPLSMAAQVQRFSLALATKPFDVFFLCYVPTQNVDNSWNESALRGCEIAKTTWIKVTSPPKDESADSYVLTKAEDHDAFPDPKVAAAVNLCIDLGNLRQGSDDRSREPSCLIEVERCKAVNGMKYFTTIAVFDFEYEVEDGELPDVLCLVVYILDEHLRLTRKIRMWRGDFGPAPPFDTGSDTLCVAYSAWAEMTCFMVLGWKFPVHVFDLHTAFLSVSNILLPYNPDEKPKRPRKRLSDACRAYEVEGWENIDKEQLAKDIGEGRWRDYGQERVFEYCEEDVRATSALLEKMLIGRARYKPTDVERVLHWSNYSAKSVAQIQARGMPIDMVLWSAVQENKTTVVRHLLRKFDPSYGTDDPIYTPDGEWSYARFEAWLGRVGVTAWPRLESGALDTDSDAFKLMAHLPGIENLHALRDSLGVIVKAKLPIGQDGRNRPSLFPFCTATGRNAHSKSLFNAHAGMRSFMKFPDDVIGVYLDWRTQEVGIAAALSGDQALMSAYNDGDIYYALAKMCGLTREANRIRWKNNSPAERQRMKGLQLGISYGMGVPSLARGLDRHPLVASTIIEQHKRKYPRFWEWRADQVTSAMLERQLDSVFGWPLYLSTSPNERTLYNFPMQSNGAEMLRLAAWHMCEAGIISNMLIHDGVLIEARGEEEIEHAKEIMRAAGREVCGGFEIGVDVDQRLEHGARYRDKRPVAQAMWRTMMEALQAVGAIPDGKLP